MSHFELQREPTQDKFRDFLQTYFEFEDAFAPNFSKNGGAGPSGPRKRNALAPHSLKNSVRKHPQIQNMFAKSQGIYLESGPVEVQNGSYSKKADKFALVQL